jgi:hypothetical protein
MAYQAVNSDANISRLADPNSVIEKIVKEIGASERSLADWKKRIIKYNELYQMVQNKKNYEGLSNIFVPEILRAVETIVGKLYQVIIGSENWFEYSGRDENDEGAAIALTQLTRYQMDENAFKAKLMDSLRQMVISGITVRKILWDFQEVQRKRTQRQLPNPQTLDPENLQGGVQPVSNIETVKDHWTFEPVDLLSFHISDVTTPYNDIQKARWIAEQYLVDKQWVAERMRKGWFSKVMKPQLDTAPSASSSEAKTLRDNRMRSSGFAMADTSTGKIEIIERWGLVEASWVYTPEEMAQLGLEPEDMCEAVVYIANRVSILKLEVNPFWHNQKPYVSCPYVPKENEFAGIGVAQIGEKLQEELNDTRNQTMDNKTLILMCMWLKHRASGIKNQDLRIRPMGVINTNDMNGLEALRPPVLTGIGVNIEGVVKSDLRESVGAASNLQGIAQSGVDTATESSIINKESLGRLLLTGELYGELVLKPTLVMSEYNNYQFYDHIKVIRIIGAQGVKFRKLAPEDLVGYKDVVIRISTDVADNPGVRRQQVMNFLTITQQMMPEQIAFHWKMLDKIYKMFFNGRSLEEVYAAPPEAATLLTPEEEIEMVLAEQPVLAKQGQNHMEMLKVLEPEFDKIKFAITPTSFQIFKALILSHHQMMIQELQMQQAQMEMQMMAAAQNGDASKTPNATPFTQDGKAPTPGSLAQGLGQ